MCDLYITYMKVSGKQHVGATGFSHLDFIAETLNGPNSNSHIQSARKKTSQLCMHENNSQAPDTSVNV